MSAISKHIKEHIKLGVTGAGNNEYIVGSGGYATIQAAVDVALAKPQILNELQLAGTADCVNGDNLIVGTLGTEEFMSEMAVAGFGYALIAFSNDTTRVWYPYRDVIIDSEIYLECPFFGGTGTYNVYVADASIHHIKILNDNIDEVHIEPQTGVSGTDEMACLSFDFMGNEFNGEVVNGLLGGVGQRCGIIEFHNLKKTNRLANLKTMLIQNFWGILPTEKTAVSYVFDNVMAKLFGVDVTFMGDSAKVDIRNSYMATMQDGNYTNCKGSYRSRDSTFHCGYGGWGAHGRGAAIKTPCKGDNSVGVSTNDTFIMTPKNDMPANDGSGAVVVAMAFIRQISGQVGNNISMHFVNSVFESTLDTNQPISTADVAFCAFDKDTDATLYDDGIDLHFIDCKYLETGSKTIVPAASWRMFTSDATILSITKKKLHVIRSEFPDWANDWDAIDVVEFVQSDTVRTFSDISGGITPAAELDLLRATTHILDGLSVALTAITAPVGTYPDGTVVKFICIQDATGGRQIAFTPDYVLGTLTASGGANTQCKFEFTWNASRAKWIQTSADNQWL